MAPLNRWTSSVIAIYLAITLTASGCVSNKPKKRPSSPAPSVTLTLPSTPTNPRQAAEQAALAAYRGMWQAYVDALAVPNPDYPKLALYATGNALRTLTTGVGKARGQGLKGTGTMQVRPGVIGATPEAQPTKIEISDCVDTADSVMVRISPGPPYSDSPGGLRLCRAAAQLQSDGSWKVIDFGLHEVGTCS